jgi:hypothetical protein
MGQVSDKYTVKLYLTLIFTFLTLSSIFAKEDLGVVVDTCNCPGLENFASDIHSIVSEVYKDDKPSEVPIQFDQLTLLMDLQTKLETDFSCGETFGELSPYEVQISDELSSGGPLSDVIKDTLRYSGTLELGEFRPSFMRAITEEDRTLFFKGVIAGEEKYIVMHIDRDGKAQVEILDEPATPFESVPAGALADTSIPLNFNTAFLFPDTPYAPSAITGEGEAPTISMDETSPMGNNSPMTSLMQTMPDALMRTPGVQVDSRMDGVGVQGAVRTDNGNILQGGVDLRIRGGFPMEQTGGTQTLSFGDSINPNNPIRDVRVGADFKYVNGLGSAVSEGPLEDTDHEIEVRGGAAVTYDANGERINTETNIGTSYRFGDNAFDFDIRSDELQLERPEYEFRFGNLDANQMQVSSIQQGLNIKTPYLSFDGNQRIESDMGDFGMGHSMFGGANPYAPQDDEEESGPGNYYSLGVLGEVGGDLKSADFTLARQNGERMTFATGQYNFLEDTYDVSAATGTKERRGEIRVIDSTYGGRTFSLSGYNQTNVDIDGGDRTNELTFGLNLRESEYNPSDGRIDYVRTDRTTSADGLSTRDTRTHTGIEANEEGTVTLRYGRTKEESFSLDTSVGAEDNTNPMIRDMGIQEYASRTGQIAAELTIGENEQSLRAMTSRETTVHGISRGLAGDLYIMRNDYGESMEFGLTAMSGEGSFTHRNTKRCRVGARIERGYVMANPSPRIFSGGSATGSSLDCNVVFTKDDNGTGAELSARYSVTKQNRSMFVEVYGDFNSYTDPELKINSGLEVRW